jgi:hypothetical protein
MDAGEREGTPPRPRERSPPKLAALRAARLAVVPPPESDGDGDSRATFEVEVQHLHQLEAAGAAPSAQAEAEAEPPQPRPQGERAQANSRAQAQETGPETVTPSRERRVKNKAPALSVNFDKMPPEVATATEKKGVRLMKAYGTASRLGTRIVRRRSSEFQFEHEQARQEELSRRSDNFLLKLDGTEHRAELKHIFTESSRLLTERLQRLAVLDTYVQAREEPEAGLDEGLLHYASLILVYMESLYKRNTK